jgi:hypothetical protein
VQKGTGRARLQAGDAVKFVSLLILVTIFRMYAGTGAVVRRLLVSKGAIVWRKKWKSKRGRKLGWARFHELMQEHGRRI